jgi:hypothetical protein
MFSRRITSIGGRKKMNRIWEYGLRTGFESLPYGELRELQNRNRFIWETLRFRRPSLRYLYSAQFLSSVESFVPEELICSQNYSEMKTLASHFPGGISSFFGFESRLNSADGRADYLFAVSSGGGEREALANLIRNGSLPENFTDNPEWQTVGRFVLEWANPESALYSTIRGLWFEFDMVENSSDTLVPCIFLHTIPLSMRTVEDKEKLNWLTKTAFPLLTGKKVSRKIEQHLFQAIQSLPKEAFIMDAGVMLSRQMPGVRLVITRISPNEILPYLTQIGWSEENEQLPLLLKELEEKVSRIVLHITVTEEGIEQKIGLECSFSPDMYHLETRWSSFFDYLVKKGLCLAEKKDALLQFIGVEQENPEHEFSMCLYKPSVKIQSNGFSKALVRFISHVKLVYEPGRILLAKAYPGVRLFGCPHNPSYEIH